ncbi:DUF2272 domain-containing protein [Rhizobium laguerreae]|uniref:DUF2272 domain-containing protein n=1 Tax=Rhizobium laguerreae TaxID=1076926 RepID=UPI001C90C45C|nr:DUF2272 domain-containing protein [Rhizobium laguerreae]MBY3383207.1 DUF2272 domain-containing protein [Rhizobium laguerreae]
MVTRVIQNLSTGTAQQTKVIYEAEGATVILISEANGTITAIVTDATPAPPPDPATPEAAKIDIGHGPITPPASGASQSGFASTAAILCEQEWKYFGRQEYNANGAAIRVGHKEAEAEWAKKIGEYWSFGVNISGIDGTNTDHPWSAAFISWIMRSVRNNETLFRYSSRHAVFISQAIRQRLAGVEASFWGHRLNEHRPRVGDIVCYARESGVDYDHQKSGDYDGHSDIVVQVEESLIWVIGGNVGNSVTKRPLELDLNGYVKPGIVSGELLFAILECRIDQSEAQLADETSDAADPVGDVATPQTPSATANVIAWGKKVSAEFRARITAIAAGLSCDPSHLMAAMAFETGESFSASKTNPYSNATGLIQFMPKTAISLGTTINLLAEMNAVQQLDYVEKYMSPFSGKMNSLSDVYMAILYPKAVGKPEAQVLFSQGTIAYTQNAGLDTNDDGVVTKGEATSKVQAMLAKGLSTNLAG